MTRHTLSTAGSALRDALRTPHDLPRLFAQLAELVAPDRPSAPARPCRDDRLVARLRGVCRAVTHAPTSRGDVVVAHELGTLGLVHGRWRGPRSAVAFFYFPDLDLGVAADARARRHWRFQLQARHDLELKPEGRAADRLRDALQARDDKMAD